LQRTLLGKTILFTDNADWTDAALVRGYRSQHQIESGFRDLKDPQHIALRPQRHWTDQKIRVHVFYGILALLLCSLLRRELHRRGIDQSLPRILEQLGQIREVGVIYPVSGDQRSPTMQMTFSRMTEEQRLLYETLALGRYALT
jgi:transposase